MLRLGVMWPGVEPTMGNYNQTYLDQIEIIVNNMAAQSIYVIMDMHQDLLHRKYCGEGVPDYIFDICYANQPSSTLPFPLPVTSDEYPDGYPLDSDGYPAMEACLSKGFFDYYLSSEVASFYDCIYRNVEGIWDHFGNFWKTVVQRFKSFDNVLGYELINEPWVITFIALYVEIIV